MRALVVGSGAREHAIVEALARSPRIDRLFAAPGNPGIARIAELVPAPADDVEAIVAAAERHAVDLTVVGPEGPLVSGLADALTARGLPVFGPSAAAARLEGSKSWARDLCDRHGIPAPRSRAFHEMGPAVEFLDELEPPYVVKADGLAGGKGVTIAEDRPAAVAALEERLVRGAFGAAGRRVLVEEHLEGPEVSALALTDGRDVVPLALAQDHKRALDGDRGPNTGGMGAYSPVPLVGEDTERLIVEQILRPTVRALEAEGVRYVGVVYAGLMLTPDGPKILEFNCRLGDPEAQVILPRLESDLAGLLLGCVDGTLGTPEVLWTDCACVGVVLASRGYPGPHETGFPLHGVQDAERLPGVHVFHAGTAVRGTVVTAGGRVLTVSALGADLEAARALAYRACSLIRFEGMVYRRDIAYRERVGAG